MTDTFSRVCAIVALILLAAIAGRPVASRSEPARYPFARNPVYKVFEVDPDAKQINEILTKYGDEGAFQLAAAPIIRTGDSNKVILVLEQHW